MVVKWDCDYYDTLMALFSYLAENAACAGGYSLSEISSGLCRVFHDSYVKPSCYDEENPVIYADLPDDVLKMCDVLLGEAACGRLEGYNLRYDQGTFWSDQLKAEAKREYLRELQAERDALEREYALRLRRRIRRQNREYKKHLLELDIEEHLRHCDAYGASPDVGSFVSKTFRYNEVRRMFREIRRDMKG